MEPIEDLDFGRFCTQGTVAVGVIILICTVSFPQADWLSIARAGSQPDAMGSSSGRVLSRLFRGKLLTSLKQSYRRNQLCFAGKLTDLSRPRAFYALLASLRRREWVVYSKPPFGGPEHVLRYLARYTHRVAISNGRLLSLENGQVHFRWRDSHHNNRSSVMRLDATEFIRRFLLHVLPAGFIKIRHFGLLANRNRRQALSLCRTHLCTTARDLNTLLTETQKSALQRQLLCAFRLGLSLLSNLSTLR